MVPSLNIVGDVVTRGHTSPGSRDTYWLLGDGGRGGAGVAVGCREVRVLTARLGDERGEAGTWHSATPDRPRWQIASVRQAAGTTGVWSPGSASD